ncbi:HAD family hydrolase [Pseudonocardia sp. WMMC193]|uniref:HAD family hydrolase n=1 Tax=Pseudonocardia sp. WMMC193 TaxID=2911965 RepID=UPI001F1E38DA|nr:HAD family hydrolase [Pseudonocardia sp. WMMC193]MCF7553163.1 HAD family hydrolase [Pseudonocardia sp. WMMC193]
MVEAVVFDWGGTLTPWITMDFRAGWETYTSILHAEDPLLAREVASALAAADTGRWAAVKDGAKAFHLGEVLADAAVDTSSELHGRALEAYREFWVQATHTDPEAAPMLAALQERGIKLGVLSSTMWPGEWHEEWLRRDGVLHYFDGVTWSSDLEFTKPHPTAFEAALAAVGATDPARCVYVGDRPYDDISGAKGIGMRAVLVPHSDIPVDQQVPVDVSPDGVIQRLAELPDLIEHW